MRLPPFRAEHALLVQRDSALTDRQMLFIYRFQAAAGPALSVCVDALLIGCFGLFPETPGEAELWMLMTEDARRRFPKITLQVGHAVVYSALHYHLLTKLRVRIQRTDARARRYAERLRFHVEPFDDATEEYMTMELDI